MPVTPVHDLRQFFATAIEQAVTRCGLSLDDAIRGHLTSVLLTCSSRTAIGGSIVVELDHALTLAPELQLSSLVAVGDRALFLSGFVGRQSDEAVLHRCGPFAYARAATLSRDDTSALYQSMARRFTALTHVLTEVAVAQSLGAATRDLVRMYDAWKRSKSPSALDAMTREGVFPHDDEAEA
jgi:hypothetical protein